MKPINFLNTLSTQEQRAITKWFKITRTSFMTLITIIISAHLYQGYQLWQVRSEKILVAGSYSFDPAIQQKEQKLISQEKEINTLIDQLTVYDEQQTKMQEALMALATSAQQPGGLTACTLNQQELDCTIECSGAQAALGCVTSLNECAYFNDCKLLSLRPQKTADNHRVIAHIKGVVR